MDTDINKLKTDFTNAFLALCAAEGDFEAELNTETAEYAANGQTVRTPKAVTYMVRFPVYSLIIA